MAQKVKLTYFKQSGKYYSEGDYVTHQDLHVRIVQEVWRMAKENKLPGLNDGIESTEGIHVLVVSDLEPPYLILSPYTKKGLDAYLKARAKQGI